MEGAGSHEAPPFSLEHVLFVSPVAWPEQGKGSCFSEWAGRVADAWPSQR